jgi:hypothetical protein
MDDSDVAKPEGFDQRTDNFVMRNRTVRFGRRWCGHQSQFFTADGPAAVANAL